jgi:NAD-dependent SIR2 family protein deacetylase
MGKTKKRKYYRKCGECGNRQEQSYMVRVKPEYSDNGWLCRECYEDIINQDVVDFDDEW